MIRRKKEKELMQLTKLFPAVCMLGPRQVGKTTLAKKLAATVKKPVVYLDLERNTDKLKLHDAESYLAQHEDKCVIIDEVQFMPELFNVMRPLIDDKRVAGRFILTGSASPEMIKGVSESLAGRVAYVELAPFDLKELGKKPPMMKHWFRGGFPGSYLARRDNDSIKWLDYFIKSYIERDLSMLFEIHFSRSTMQKFWNMLAHHHGSVWNAESFARSLAITGPTVNRYLDFLEGAFIIHKLPAYSHNTKKRLVRSPKIYIRDSGVLHRLCHFNHDEDLKGHIIVGNSWEGYAIEQIRNTMPSHLRAYYYRTHDGAEIDLVLEKGHKVVACIEIKLSNTPNISNWFYSISSELKCTNNFIITPASENYLNPAKVRLCSLNDFLTKYLPGI